MPLGILPLNENKSEDMIQILSHLQQYELVRKYEAEVVVPPIEETVKVLKFCVAWFYWGVIN